MREMERNPLKSKDSVVTCLNFQRRVNWMSNIVRYTDWMSNIKNSPKFHISEEMENERSIIKEQHMSFPLPSLGLPLFLGALHISSICILLFFYQLDLTKKTRFLCICLSSERPVTLIATNIIIWKNFPRNEYISSIFVSH